MGDRAGLGFSLWAVLRLVSRVAELVGTVAEVACLAVGVVMILISARRRVFSTVIGSTGGRYQQMARCLRKNHRYFVAGSCFDEKGREGGGVGPPGGKGKGKG